MAKKILEKQAYCPWREKGARGLYFFGAVFFGAFGIAAMLQGILMQISLGFTYGLFAYFIGLLFLGIAKMLKWKVYGCAMHH